MRLFIAIHFNHDSHSQLVHLCDELRTHAQQGKISRPENLHLTLAFLGECNEKQTAVVKDIMDSIVFQPFDIAIDRLGCFKRSGGDIWWAGVQERKQLLDLQRTLSEQLVTSGFTLEQRKYRPHITLGREIITDIQPWKIETFGEIADTIDLMKSERIHGKLTYTPIHKKNAKTED